MEDELFADWTLASSLILFCDFVLVDDVDVFDFGELGGASVPLLVFDDVGEEGFQKSVENWLVEGISVHFGEHGSTSDLWFVFKAMISKSITRSALT